MTESNSNPRAESIEQVRKRVTKEVFIELGIYRHADSMPALVDFDAKVIGKLIEARILLEPSPCDVDGHLREHWVEPDPRNGEHTQFAPYCTLCEREKAVRLDEAKWWQHHAGLGVCTLEGPDKCKRCPYCQRIAELEAE